MGFTRGRRHPCGSHVGPMSLAIWDSSPIIFFDQVTKYDCLHNDLGIISWIVDDIFSDNIYVNTDREFLLIVLGAII